MPGSPIVTTTTTIMDFLARLNAGLVEPPKPRSKLASYFEAHMLFQGTYHMPSPTPSPPSSPGLAPPVLAASNQSQPPISSPQLRSRKRKCATDDDSDRIRALPKQMRTSHAAYNCAMQPLTPEITATPPSSTGSMSPPLLPSCMVIKEPKKSVFGTSAAHKARNHAVQQRTSIRVGKYTLRRTAARAQRRGDQGSVT